MGFRSQLLAPERRQRMVQRMAGNSPTAGATVPSGRQAAPMAPHTKGPNAPSPAPQRPPRSPNAMDFVPTAAAGYAIADAKGVFDGGLAGMTGTPIQASAEGATALTPGGEILATGVSETGVPLSEATLAETGLVSGTATPGSVGMVAPGIASGVHAAPVGAELGALVQPSALVPGAMEAGSAALPLTEAAIAAPTAAAAPAAATPLAAAATAAPEAATLAGAGAESGLAAFGGAAAGALPWVAGGLVIDELLGLGIRESVFGF